MKPIIIVMFCAQALFLVVASWTVLKGKATTPRGRPIWSSLAFSLILGGLASLDIADKHPGPAAELLDFGGGILFGMAIMSLLVLFRRHRLGPDALA
ncbi:MAG TPA: hypothetical protein VH331_08155 [Allosphingosinicella sp.]|jgi:hypothetical protein|nr:hypothetical protein [Allosphingosinicella sp.]